MRVDEHGQRRAVAVVADIGVMGPQELVARHALARGSHARQAEIGGIRKDGGEQRVFVGARFAGAQVRECSKKAGFLRHFMQQLGDADAGHHRIEPVSQRFGIGHRDRANRGYLEAAVRAMLESLD